MWLLSVALGWWPVSAHGGAQLRHLGVTSPAAEVVCTGGSHQQDHVTHVLDAIINKTTLRPGRFSPKIYSENLSGKIYTTRDY